jgi:DNA-binding response OmpR family regulator
MAIGPGTRPADRPDEGHPQVSFAGVTLDVATRNLTLPHQDHDVALTPLQAAILRHLMTHSGQECSRDDLMRYALGYAEPIGSRTVDVHVATLRHKLRGALHIRSIRGVGYALEPVIPRQLR